MNDKETDMEPTLVVTTPDNYLVEVGKPECVTKKDLFEYVKKGYTIKTVTFKEYKGMNLKWFFEKNK